MNPTLARLDEIENHYWDEPGFVDTVDLTWLITTFRETLASLDAVSADRNLLDDCSIKLNIENTELNTTLRASLAREAELEKKSVPRYMVWALIQACDYARQELLKMDQTDEIKTKINFLESRVAETEKFCRSIGRRGKNEYTK